MKNRRKNNIAAVEEETNVEPKADEEDDWVPMEGGT
jgi:hypothetical protein